MVIIDTNDLKEMLDFLSLLIGRYEEATTDLFNTIGYTSNFWNDENSRKFYNKISAERMALNRFRSSLKQREKTYKFIYDSYIKYGKIITCDFENKDVVLRKLDFAIEQLDSTIRMFNALDTGFQFKEKSNLSSQIRRLVQTRKDWKNYRTALRRFFEQIEDIEARVRRQISNLEKIVIKHFTSE
jgi:hypothetical protein